MMQDDNQMFGNLLSVLQSDCFCQLAHRMQQEHWLPLKIFTDKNLQGSHFRRIPNHCTQSLHNTAHTSVGHHLFRKKNTSKADFLETYFSVKIRF